jgi:hypothetical protein
LVQQFSTTSEYLEGFRQGETNMNDNRRIYTAPVLRSEALEMGIFGDYSADTGNDAPIKHRFGSGEDLNRF